MTNITGTNTGHLIRQGSRNRICGKALVISSTDTPSANSSSFKEFEATTAYLAGCGASDHGSFGAGSASGVELTMPGLASPARASWVASGQCSSE